MKKKIKLLQAAVVLSLLTSCQKVIEVDIPNSAPQLVIEGNLTDHLGVQTVTISTSVPYNNANVYPPVTGAQVKFMDAYGNNYPLTEKTPGTYSINKFKAVAPNVYFLNVTTGGKSYTASSVMPFGVNLDSLSLSGELLGNKIVKTVSVNYHDPKGISNQYRFILYVNGVQVKRVFVNNDMFSDGRVVSTPLYQDDIELKSGDVVSVDMQCLDPFIYNYFYSLSSQNGNTPADSSTPSNPTSNFDNGALGYFSAHTIQRQTATIP